MDTTLNISKVVSKKEGKNPLLVTFQNGQLEQRQGVKRKVEFTRIDKNSSKVNLTTESGQEFVGVSVPPNGIKTFLCIRNKFTNKTKLIKVGSVELKNKLFLDATPAEIPEPTVDEKSRHATLMRTFGGKRVVRKLEQRDKLKLDASTVEKSLNETIVSMKVREEEPSSAEQLDLSLEAIIPPCHRNAKQVSEVYQLREVIGEGLAAQYQQFVFDLEETTDIKSLIDSMCPLAQFVWSMAENNPTGDRSSKIFSVILVDGLINMVKLTARDLRNRATKLNSSTAVSEWLIENFCQKINGTLTRSLSLKDKTLCYAMVLSFLGGNNILSLDILAKDTSVGVKKLSLLCRAVGGVPKAKGSNLYELKLPLPPLPVMPRVRNRN